MTQVINGFLNVSRLESVKIVLATAEFSLDKLIEEIVHETGSMEQSHRIQFSRDKPVGITADYDKIENVINNLLNYAIKYSKPGTDIEIGYHATDKEVTPRVTNHGIGIDTADIHKLFERFYRVQGNHNVSGFGIGLYLSAEIIHRHNGKIWVESELGQGSTFYFSFPRG